MEATPRPRKAPVPLLLESFPIPPTYIPSTPTTTASNPPPSGPPSTPLPPVPGPSRISEYDTLNLLFAASTSSRRYSGGRDSVLSNRSTNSGPASPRIPSTSRRPSSVAVSPLLGVDDERRRRRRNHQANESISEIDFRDILSSVMSDDEDVLVPGPPMFSRRTTTVSPRSSASPVPPPLSPRASGIPASPRDSASIPPGSPLRRHFNRGEGPQLSSGSQLPYTHQQGHGYRPSVADLIDPAHSQGRRKDEEYSILSEGWGFRSASERPPVSPGAGRPRVSSSEGPPGSASVSPSEHPPVPTSAPPISTSPRPISASSPPSASSHPRIPPSTSDTTTSPSPSTISTSPEQDAALLHRQLRSTRSRSASHKQQLASRPLVPPLEEMPPPPSRGGLEPSVSILSTASTSGSLASLATSVSSSTTTARTTPSSITPTTSMTSTSTNDTSPFPDSPPSKPASHANGSSASAKEAKSTSVPSRNSSSKNASSASSIPSKPFSAPRTASPPPPRGTSPDIDTILSQTPKPRPASRTRPRLSSTGTGTGPRVSGGGPRLSGASDPRLSVASEGSNSRESKTVSPRESQISSRESKIVSPRESMASSRDSKISTREPKPSIAFHLPTPGKRRVSDGVLGTISTPMNGDTIKRRVSDGLVVTPVVGNWRESEGGSVGGYYSRARRQYSSYYEGEEGMTPDMEARLERALEGDGSSDDDLVPGGVRTRVRGRRRPGRKVGGGGGEDSDSSLDLHTPLPHLMLRHGLLSPNSKLLPRESESRMDVDGRPGSTMSVVSNTTTAKTGIIKDERDTPMRRVRHRDGRLLRGGIGLTTGLGWSDSEDEDAPSPLTRRLSTLNLSRRSSAASLGGHSLRSVSSAKHPLSRSYSSGALIEDAREDFFNDDLTTSSTSHAPSSFGLKGRTSLPPTAWQRKASSATGSRTSTSSTGSRFSLEVSIPEDGPTNPGSRTPSRMRRPSAGRTGHPESWRESAGSSTGGKEEGTTPSSTASTLSIPMPVTPQADWKSPTSPPLDKDKSLPPLPMQRYPSKTRISPVGNVGSTTSKYSFPRARTYSATANSASTPLPQVQSPPTSPSVKPLQLPRLGSRIAFAGGDRPAVPVPSVPSSPPLCAPGTPTETKPKPRTGTGMTYRSASKMRAPMQLASASVVGAAATTGRVGTVSAPRAIAL